MKTNLIIFTVLIGLVACQPNQPNRPDPNATLAELEAAVANNDTKEFKLALANKYLEHATKNPQEHDKNANNLNKAANIFYANNNTTTAIGALNLSIRNHFSSNSTPKNAAFLSKIYKEKYPNSKYALYINQLMTKAFPNYDKIGDIQKAIPDNPLPLEAELASLKSQMTNEQTGRLDMPIAKDFMSLSEMMAMFAPADEKSPDYLLKAGEVARSIRAFQKATDIYNWVFTKYPNSKYAPQALFMLAFTYDNELNQKANAENLYREFLKRYPNDDFADDTQFLLDNITKSNEEIIEGFDGDDKEKQ